MECEGGWGCGVFDKSCEQAVIEQTEACFLRIGVCVPA